MTVLLEALFNLWMHPQWLWGLLVVPAMLLVFLLTQLRRRQVLARLGNIELLAALAAGLSPGLRWLKTSLLALGVAFAVLAAARPQWGTITQLVQAEGVDIVIALDTSLSMLAEDVPPNRLAAAKHEISSFVQGLASDRVALVPFAGVAFIQCPLTLDYHALRLFLDDINTNSMPVEGTAIGTAIRTSLEAFVEEGGHRVVILITDGEDHESQPLEAAEEAAEQGVRIYTIGIGSPEGELIPQRSSVGRVEFLRDRQGRVVKTRLDEVTLQRIAVTTGGKYYRSTAGELELEQIFDDIASMETRGYEEQQRVTRVDRYQWPLGFAVLLLLLAPFIPERRRAREGNR